MHDGLAESGESGGAGEQPAGVGVGSSAHVRAVRGLLHEQRGEWFGDPGGRVAETEEHLAVLREDVIGAHPGDTGDGLA
ncbi:hypothetical protein GCM10010411_82140 [Actinomadura fulvescens]|uniref:Uncharacterized protein n=1 Tax=Actinomadura fulvescens TaxID=46160 RepID=A0ABP6D403_9ACTN